MRVVLPELQQVVAGDVGAIASRDERRHAQTAPHCTSQDGASQRAALTEEADRGATWHHRCQRCVERNVCICVDDPQGIGADHAHAQSACPADEGPLAVGSGRSAVGEAARHHKHPRDTRRPAFVDDTLHLLGRHSDDREGDRLEDVEYGGVGRDVKHSLVLGRRGSVDRRNPARIATRHKVLQQPVPERSGIAPRADDDDGLRRDQRGHTPSLRAMLP